MRNHLADDVLNMSPSLATIQVVKGGRFCFSVSVIIIIYRNRLLFHLFCEAE